jgi:hypothetical protein
MLAILTLLALAVAANVVNGKAGVAGYFGGGRPETWLITVGLFAAALAVAGYATVGRWDGIFIDNQNRISLSRFQLILWTLLLVSALMTAGLINAMKPADPTPLQIRIPPKIWALLGLGAFTAVAAPTIDQHTSISAFETTAFAGTNATEAEAEKGRIKSALAKEQNIPEPKFAGALLIKNGPNDARWIDIIRGDSAGALLVDVAKMQQLAFTLLLISVYAMTLRTKMAGTGDIDEFPDIDAGFLALLGLSHAAYLADKQIGFT